MLEVVMPKNFVNLMAGLVGLVFERVGKLSQANEVQRETKVEQAKQTLAPAAETPQPPDDLTVINGIGPTFARRLKEAGVDTFAKLAAAQPEEIKAAAKLADWQADPANWITAAKQLT